MAFLVTCVLLALMIMVGMFVLQFVMMAVFAVAGGTIAFFVCLARWIKTGSWSES